MALTLSCFHIFPLSMKIPTLFLLIAFKKNKRVLVTFLVDALSVFHPDNPHHLDSSTYRLETIPTTVLQSHEDRDWHRREHDECIISSLGIIVYSIISSIFLSKWSRSTSSILWRSSCLPQTKSSNIQQCRFKLHELQTARFAEIREVKGFVGASVWWAI